MRTGVFKKALALVLCTSLLNCGDLITIVKAGTLAAKDMQAVEETGSVSSGDVAGAVTGDMEQTGTVSSGNAVITRYDYRSDEVNVLVTLTDPEDLPDDAELVVTPVVLSEEAEEKLTEEAIKEQRTIESMMAYDPVAHEEWRAHFQPGLFQARQ